MKFISSLTIASLVVLTSLCFEAPAVAQYLFTEINDPNSTIGFGTFPTDISGNDITGYYLTSSGSNGFLYNGSTYTSIVVPSGNNSRPLGFLGSDIYGTYTAQNTGIASGFLYNGTTYTTIRPPSASGDVQILGSNGTNIYGEVNGQLFSYNGSTYGTLVQPTLPAGAAITGFNGSTYFGTLTLNSSTDGFIYNGTSLTDISDPLPFTAPGSQQVTGTEIGGVSGSTVVGLYIDAGNVAHGFVFDGTIYTTIDDPNFVPGGIEAVSGTDGTNLVGFYLTQTGYHGFEASPVPEPSYLSLLGLGLSGIVLMYGFSRRPIPL